MFCVSIGRLSLSCTVSWNFSLQLENGPKLPGVLRLLLQNTGHWPVHDIKSFAIGTFLSSLLLQEQIKISDKKNVCEIIPSPNEIEKQMGALNTKLPVLKKQHLNLKVVNVSGTVVVFAQANAQHSSSSPPPPKKEKLARNCCFFNYGCTTKFVPNFPAKFPQNRPFFLQICL